MTKVKICGIWEFETIDILNECLPDYIGFVFAKSPRQVTEDRAKELKGRLHPQIKTAGVFVNESIEKILKIIDNVNIDAIQLHGDEDDSYIKKLKEKTKAEIWKAVRVKEGMSLDFSKIPADRILLDTYKTGVFGGSGEKFDWSLVDVKIYKDIILAGGINLDNVSQALKLSPYMLDISSGVESNGRKDGGKTAKIIKLIRGE
ncbi:MAG: phosphoribosylanthranilate isomerase [Clostridiaceae bacterium]|nr:phosphoribosylanthranilate isomerase [Clostridiaceae bacterium]